MTEYQPCEFESKLNLHLSTCTYKKKCDYQKFFSGIRTPYCKKKQRIEEAEKIFQRMRSKLERDVLGDAL